MEGSNGVDQVAGHLNHLRRLAFRNQDVGV